MENGSHKDTHEEAPKRASKRAAPAPVARFESDELDALRAIEGHLANIAHTQVAMLEVLSRIERHSIASTKALIRLQSAASLQLEIAAAQLGAPAGANGGNDGG